MNIDIIVVDFLQTNGELTCFKIKSKNNDKKITIDHLKDIYPEYNSKNILDIGSTRIYNSNDCEINKFLSRIRNVSMKNDEITFQFEHMYIPVGASREAHAGIWNFILPPGLRLTELFVSDPYDKNEKVEKKKQFKYQVLWDTECKTQVVSMELRSGRGSFSFIVKGKARLFNFKNNNDKFLQANEYDHIISDIADINLLNEKGRKILVNEISIIAEHKSVEQSDNGQDVTNNVLNECVKYFKRNLLNK